MPRYVLFPGPVRSKNDDQLHHVNPAMLRWLYRVPIGAPWIDACRPLQPGQAPYVPHPDDIECRPRADGQYPRMSTVAVAPAQGFERFKAGYVGAHHGQ